MDEFFPDVAHALMANASREQLESTRQRFTSKLLQAYAAASPEVMAAVMGDASATPELKATYRLGSLSAAAEILKAGIILRQEKPEPLPHDMSIETARYLDKLYATLPEHMRNLPTFGCGWGWD